MSPSFPQGFCCYGRKILDQDVTTLEEPQIIITASQNDTTPNEYDTMSEQTEDPEQNVNLQKKIRKPRVSQETGRSHYNHNLRS